MWEEFKMNQMQTARESCGVNNDGKKKVAWQTHSIKLAVTEKSHEIYKENRRAIKT